jgi:hypothetical protein
MKLPEFSVKQPVAALMIFLGLILIGSLCLFRLNIDMLPDINPPVISILTTWPGASASDVESEVTRPIEDHVNGVNNLDELTSKSLDNLSVVSCKFNWGTNLAVAINDVRDKLELAKRDMPDDAETPMIFKFSSASAPVLFMNITGDKTWPRLYRLVDKHISDETDFLKCCGFYSNYGGMTVAAKALSGKNPKTYYGDTRDPANVSVTDFADELRRVVRAKLLNPKYINGMKQHGYKGAGDLNKRIGRVYGFGATTGEVDNWIFDEITKTFMLDPEMKEWFEKVNPWALEEIGRRLLEAESRDIWEPDPQLLEQLKEAYLDTEACLEDRMDDVTGDFQGGAVDIMTSDDVESWNEKIKDIKKIIQDATSSQDL